MASDLGAKTAEVHAKARKVLGFWFDLLMPEQWFAGSHALDAEIEALFAPLLAEGIAQFGRFPMRNAALGRESTAEEKVYLSQPGVGW